MIFTSRDFPYPQRMGFASGESPPPREWYSPQGDSLSTATGIRFKGFPSSIANVIRINCVTLSKRLGFAPRGSPSPKRMGFASRGSPSPKRLGVSWIVESLRVGFRIPFDRRPPYPSGLSLPDSVIASAHRYSRLNQGTSSPFSEGPSRNSLSVSRLLQQFLPHPEGFGVVALHH